MAWLNAAPRPDNHRSGDPEPPTRIAEMAAADMAPPIPPNSLKYLTDWLFEIGPCVAAGMGAGAIGWRDLAAWQDLTGIELMPWEARLLRTLSRAFVDQSWRSEKPDCPAPWLPPELDAESRAAASRRIGAALDALISTRPARNPT